MRVHDERGGRLLQDLDVGLGQQRTVLDAIEVYGFEPVDAVTRDAAAIGFDEDVGADLGILAGDAVRLEDVDHEVVHEVEGNVGLRGIFSAHDLLLAVVSCHCS